MTTPRALRPFLVAQYRILAGALLLSLLGAGIWIVSVVYQVQELGGGPVELSFIATAGAIGMLVAVLFGGVLADRVPQKRILLAVEATKGVAIAAAASLAVADALELWHLVVVGVVLGLADGCFYPAYSALLPSVLPADQLLAANGVEGMLRPAIMNALGPFIAAGVIAAASPTVGFVIVGGTQLLAVAGLLFLRTTPVRREAPDPDAPPVHPVVAMLGDVREGFVYMVRTPWFFATLLFACLMILVIMGPIEVLLPFAVRDQTGTGPAGFALVLAAFGLGGAISSIVVASLKLPRRYLTVMTLAWGASCIPLAVIGFTSQLWVMAVAVFICGAGFSVGQVIWGTLLQRRVPPAMLGRASSLDFFVSLTLMPISMALAGPVGEAVGFGWVFLVAGTVPVVLAVIAIVVAKMPRDELEHPLDTDPPNDPDATERAVAEAAADSAERGAQDRLR